MATGLYTAKRAPELIDVPPLRFLTIDGRGDPTSSAVFQEAVQALFGVSYAAKFILERERGVEHKVGPLEGLWWTPTGSVLDAPRESWSWTLLIHQPPELDDEVLARAVAANPSPAAQLLRLDDRHEGLAAQILHVGPYAEERPTIERLHAFIADAGYVPRGEHHELYLGDPRRAAPEKLRTILRQPVAVQ